MKKTALRLERRTLCCTACNNPRYNTILALPNHYHPMWPFISWKGLILDNLLVSFWSQVDEPGSDARRFSSLSTSQIERNNDSRQPIVQQFVIRTRTQDALLAHNNSQRITLEMLAAHGCFLPLEHDAVARRGRRRQINNNDDMESARQNRSIVQPAAGLLLRHTSNRAQRIVSPAATDQHAMVDLF